MARRSRRLGVWLLVLGTAGCARGGSAFELTEDPALTGDGGSDAAADGGNGPDDAEAPVGDGDGDGDGDDAPDASTDGGPADAPPDPALCTLQNTCDTSRTIGTGTLSGDGGEGGELVLQTTGTRSEWLNVRVAELDGALFTRVDMNFVVRLAIQGEANYDLFVYHPDNDKDVSCDSPRQSSTNPDQIGEETRSQVTDVAGADDSRNVRIEVRHVSGECGSWTLSIEGNK